MDDLSKGRRAPSGTFATVMGHLDQARRELRGGAGEPAEATERVASVPRPVVTDPLRVAAALIVQRIRHDHAGDTDEEHVAWVRRLLEEHERSAGR